MSNDKWLERGKKLQEVGDKMQKTGDKMSSVGTTLTIGITIPILLTIFLGIPGFIVGAIIFIGTLGSVFSKKE